MKDPRKKGEGRTEKNRASQPHKAPLPVVPAADDIMTEQEVAQLFDVTKRTIARWVEQKILPSVKIGGIRLFSRQLVLHLLYRKMTRSHSLYNQKKDI